MFCGENALKLSYSSLEFEKLSGWRPRTPLKGEGRKGKKERREEDERVGMGGNEGEEEGREGPEWDPVRAYKPGYRSDFFYSPGVTILEL
jgi:hypothetical protein